MSKIDRISYDALYKKILSIRDEIFEEVYSKKDDTVYIEIKDSSNLEIELDYFTHIANYFSTEDNIFIRASLVELIDEIVQNYGMEIFSRIKVRWGIDALWFSAKGHFDSDEFEEYFLNVSYDLFKDSKVRAKIIQDCLPPLDCPSLKSVKNYNKPMRNKILEYIEKYKGAKWTNGEDINICRWLALKYTFNKKHISYQKLYNNLKAYNYQNN
tara:strand:+ start:94 stop:732 length:639 start_codon:yes stop_codon:yes gene_type:complete